MNEFSCPSYSISSSICWVTRSVTRQVRCMLMLCKNSNDIAPHDLASSSHFAPWLHFDLINSLRLSLTRMIFSMMTDPTGRVPHNSEAQIMKFIVCIINNVNANGNNNDDNVKCFYVYCTVCFFFIIFTYYFKAELNKWRRFVYILKHASEYGIIQVFLFTNSYIFFIIISLSKYSDHIEWEAVVNEEQKMKEKKLAWSNWVESGDQLQLSYVFM